MHRKILIMGLPGAGKTTLARCIAPQINAVLFNADEVRANVNKDIGFSEADRIEQARRMGWLCDQVTKVGCYAIADFVCPTPETRAAFTEGGDCFVIWLDRIKTSRFEDTNKLFAAPERFDLRVTAEGGPEFWAETAIRRVRPVFDPTRPTALFVGRYQPFHEGHKRLIVEGLKRAGQVCIGVRQSPAEAADKKSVLVRGRAGTYRACATRVRRTLSGDPAAQYQPRAVRTRCRLRSTEDRSQFGDRTDLRDRPAAAAQDGLLTLRATPGDAER